MPANLPIDDDKFLEELRAGRVKSRGLVPDGLREKLPPILSGHETPATAQRVDRFFCAIAQIFDAWVNRSDSPHTQRAYRKDVLSFVEFLDAHWDAGFDWPDDAVKILSISVADVLAYRDFLVHESKAPKTQNRRISSLSGFFKYLAGAASEMRLPISVPNPAHAQFIKRASQDAVHETKALTATRARQLCGLPKGESPIAARDRAALKVFVYTGVRIGTLVRLNAGDFSESGDWSTLRINEKGDKKRTIGIHFQAAEALRELMDVAEITRGALFRPRKGPRSQAFANRHMTTAAMYALLRKYLEQLPDAMAADRCVFWPHSLRATTATLLLEAGVDIRKVQELLGHQHVTTTQIYDKRRIAVKDSASHDVPI